MSGGKTFFDFFLARNFFDAVTCRELITEIRKSPAAPAITYGHTANGAVEESVRRTMRITPSAATRDFVIEALDRHQRQIGEHFQISLTSFEEPQFLRYRVGDFFVAHQDGNTGLVRLDTDRWRRVSVSVFLNQQSEVPEADAYGGGSLIFSDFRNGAKREFKGETGSLIAFPSEITHEVTPVTHGERYSIVTWFLVR